MLSHVSIQFYHSLLNVSTHKNRDYVYRTVSAYSWCASASSFGVAIQIRWQSSDLSILETHPLSPGVKYAPSTTAPSPTTTATSAKSSSLSTSGSSDSTGKPNPGLGSGAKAGIGIGAALGVLALVAIGFLLWRRRHRYNSVKNTSDEAGNDAPEMVSGNWNEGHDLPVVVQDKKGEFSSDS